MLKEVIIGNKYNCGSSNTFNHLFEKHGKYFTVIDEETSSSNFTRYFVRFEDGHEDYFDYGSVVHYALENYKKPVITEKVVKEINYGVFGQLFVNPEVLQHAGKTNVSLKLVGVDQVCYTGDAVSFNKQQIEELIETLTEIKDAME